MYKHINLAAKRFFVRAFPNEPFDSSENPAKQLIVAAFYLYGHEWFTDVGWDACQWQWPHDELDRNGGFEGDEPWVVLLRRAMKLRPEQVAKSKTYFKATIEILLEVDDWAEGCDAISEAMRPLLKQCREDPENTAIVDWRYAPNGEPVLYTGEGFEFADPAVVKGLKDKRAADDAEFQAILNQPEPDDA